MLKGQEELDFWHQICKQSLKKYIDKVPSTILDIGAGYTYRILYDLGHIVHTLDIKPRKDFNIIHIADICDSRSLINIPKYEYVTCLGTMEHIKEFWNCPYNLLCLATQKVIIINPTSFSYHPCGYGDFWRFMPGHTQILFPNNKVEEEIHLDKNREIFAITSVVYK